jgi:hypothetical protein
MGIAASVITTIIIKTDTSRDPLLRVIVLLLREMIWKLHSASQ